jgi:hypothetical protein
MIVIVCAEFRIPLCVIGVAPDRTAPLRLCQQQHATMEPKSAANIHADMVFFNKEELENSPSRADGMSADEERAYRRAAQQIIIDVCQAMHV